MWSKNCFFLQNDPKIAESRVADGERAVILEQVTNGIAVRMAVLYLVNGGQQNAL